MIIAQAMNPLPIGSSGPPVGFQIVALVFVGLLLVLTLTAWAFKKATRGEAAFWSLVWLAAAVAIVRYDWTMVIAARLGIGRGADLLLYCSVGVMLVGFMMVYVRLRRIRRDITLIVRHLALTKAQTEQGNPTVRGGSSSEKFF